MVGVAVSGDAKFVENGTNLLVYKCDPGDYAIYVSVFSHIDWIRNITGGDLCVADQRRARQPTNLPVSGRND